MQMRLNVELSRNNFYMMCRAGRRMSLLVGRKTWLVGVLFVVMAGCFSFSAVGQPAQVSSTGKPGHSNPWAPTEVGPLPPVASLSDGVWLKGDLHLHSTHSKDASNNSVGKIIAFAQSVGMGYICITDHDKDRKSVV